MDRVTAVALFIRVVETGSFSKAAAEFGITQPTATKAVAAMEQRLGRGCCTAARAASRPTEVGALYYDRARPSPARSTRPTTWPP
jgi:DNA-binding transcriptional LysR family regulator